MSMKVRNVILTAFSTPISRIITSLLQNQRSFAILIPTMTLTFRTGFLLLLPTIPLRYSCKHSSLALRRSCLVSRSSRRSS
jgi:hypothetical protein